MSLDPRHRRLQELFVLGAELPPEEQAAFCRRHCADDEALRAELQTLLGLDGADDPDFLAEPVVMAPPTPSAVAGATTVHVTAFADPKRIGPYRILERLGEGGMGVVYVAEQVEPVRRRVALKVVKPGMDSKRVLARFDAERQALALMNHPGIARIFDAGATTEGRPYFAMELVTGQPIDRYCCDRKLTTRVRLSLFTQVCDAVQHAHQKGILHRDLKPSNVLVHEQDGEARAKVIDFGIARAMSQPLTDLTLQTLAGEMVGTLHYMSPEQADRRGGDVDSRTDVYSLGVLLYELLTGQLPVDPKALLETPVHDVPRLLREREPARPSTRITGDATSRATAALHGTDARTLARTLRGELDWITLKALAKERDHRYASASELAADVRHFLAGEPVLAGPPSTWYRLQKLARRHCAATAALLAIVVSLLAGTVIATQGLFAAKQEASRADAARVQAQGLTDVLLDTLGFADPDLSNDPNATLGDLLVRLEQRLVGKYHDAAEEARFRARFGMASWSRGHLDAAIGNLGKALAILAADPATSPLELHDLRWTHSWSTYLGNDPDSNPIWLRAKESGIAVVAAHDPELASLLRKGCHRCFTASRRSTDPLDLLQTTLQRAESQLTPNDPLWRPFADVLVGWTDPYFSTYRPGAAVAILREALRIYRDRCGLVPTHTRFGMVTQELVRAMYWSKEHAEGARLAAEARQHLLAALPNGHWYPAVMQVLLGAHQQQLGDSTSALANLDAGFRRLQEVRSFHIENIEYFLVDLILAAFAEGMEDTAFAWQLVLADRVPDGHRHGTHELVLRGRFDHVSERLSALERAVQRGEPATTIGPMLMAAHQACRDEMAADPARLAVAIGWLAGIAWRFSTAVMTRADSRQFVRETLIPFWSIEQPADRGMREWRRQAGPLLTQIWLHCGEPLRAREAARNWLARLPADRANAFVRGYAVCLAGLAEFRAAADATERASALLLMRQGYVSLDFHNFVDLVETEFRNLMQAYLENAQPEAGIDLARSRMQWLLVSDAPPDWLAYTSWVLARTRGLPAADYRLALAGGREAARAEPTLVENDLAIAMAHYRLGELPESAAALGRATDRLPANDTRVQAMAAALTSLVCNARGAAAGAAAARARFAAAANDATLAADAEYQALARELADVFGPR